MPQTKQANNKRGRFPAGGFFYREKSRYLWNWSGRLRVTSALQPCKPEHWFLVRLKCESPEPPAIAIEFAVEGAAVERRVLRFRRLPTDTGVTEWLDWFQTPLAATGFRVAFITADGSKQADRITVHRIPERDAKCHPLANVPRWSIYQPPFVPKGLTLPVPLAAIRGIVRPDELNLVESPSSLADLAGMSAGRVCVVDPTWVESLGLSMRDIEKVAERSWLVVDLATLATLLRKSGWVSIHPQTHISSHGVMSAKNEFADVPTRGLALYDIVPYGYVTPAGEFAMRVLPNSRPWRTYAAETGFASLLSSETPWSDRNAEVLSAARPMSRGELIATDLPWIAAGRFGAPVAPRTAMRLLSAHLCQPVADYTQFWNRWDATTIVVRDIADFVRRYPPLRTARWGAVTAGVEELGVSLVGSDDAAPTEHILIRTGRIDDADPHDGLPPEPMIILMKYFAREIRERTALAERLLANRILTWQFDAGARPRYASHYDSAARLPVTTAMREVKLRIGMQPRDGFVTIPRDEGILGDGSFEFLDRLFGIIREQLER